MHLFPQLRKLERAFEKEVVVIGVHSAKFLAEKQTPNLLKAVHRYQIDHPVVSDPDYHVWLAYGVRAWPTMMFIDPLGKVIAKHEGEVSADALMGYIRNMVAEFDAEGQIDRAPLPVQIQRRADSSPLSFPASVLADAASNRLFIADSNHNRIVVTALDGTVEQTIGSGEEGEKNGPFAQSQFNHPHGLALADDSLFIADTENHTIRRADLRSKTVEVVAGTGGQGFDRQTSGRSLEISLSSPWGLAYNDGLLYIAMAGLHQLWVLTPDAKMIAPYAGTGEEALVDGPPANAVLAQPSGLAMDQQRLYFTDSESSAVRYVGLDKRIPVGTIVGTGLFDFGDRDGTAADVLLQHPLGIAAHDGLLYVSDTYNHKIKRLDPTVRTSVTFLGGSEAGLEDGAASDTRLHEPGGLSVADGKLYIADTNNHAIRVADLETGELRTLELRGLDD